MARKPKAKRNWKRYPDAKLGTEKSVSYGYVGRYSDGKLGWGGPRYLGGCTDRPDMDGYEKVKADPVTYRPAEFVLCRITVEAVPGKRSRWIR
jgi:hypothetical protein